MPTYNRMGMLRRAIESVLSQSYRELELLVLNDASTDGTKEFLETFRQKDPRVVPIHNPQNNYPDISRNLNEGLALARGKYIARLDDDDYWCDPDKLRKQVEFMEAHPDHAVVGGGTIVVDAADREKFRYLKLEADAAIRDKALFANPFTHSTVLFRKELARQVGGYGSFMNAEDWELWLKMGAWGKFYNFPEYFVRYLMNEESKTFIFKRSQANEILAIVRRHRKEYPHFWPAFLLNCAQYVYSWLPLFVRKALYRVLSRAKRTLFSK